MSSFCGLHAGQLPIVGNRLIPESQQCLKKGQSQCLAMSSCSLDVSLAQCSYPSSALAWRGFLLAVVAVRRYLLASTACRRGRSSCHAYLFGRCVERGRWFRTL